MSKTPKNQYLTTILGISFSLIPIAYIFSRAFLLVTVYTGIVAWFLLKLQNKNVILPKSSLNLPLLAVFISLFLSIIFSGGEWTEGMRGLNKWFRGLLIFWVGWEILKDEKIERKLIFSFVAAFLIAVLDGTFQYFAGEDFIRGFSLGYVNGTVPRVTSSFGYFGMYASFLIMVMPIVFMWREKKKELWYFWAALLLLGLINLYWTRSRGAWLAMAFSVFLFLIFLKNWKVTFFVFLSGIILFFAIPRDQLFHHKREKGFDKTISHRFELWNEAINIMKARPATGCGLNTYVKNIEKYNPSPNGEVKDYYAHNGYLQHGAETGLIGLSAFLWLLFEYGALVFKKWKKGKLKTEDRMLVLGVAGFLFYMFFDTIFHNLQPFLLFWLLLGWSAGKLEAK